MRRPRRVAAARLARTGLLLVAAPCGAHAPDAVTHATSWAQWSFDPWVLACLAASAFVYAAGVVRLWRRAGWRRGVQPGSVAAFAAGWLVLAAALVTPLDALSERSFAAHMVQHELLMAAAAPLVVLGQPLAAFAWALPAHWRPAIGRAFRARAWRVPWRRVTTPLAASTLHALALWLWHAPALFDAALAAPALHALQHGTFVLSALLFWWSVFEAARRGARLVAVAALFTTMVHSGALGALLALSARVWYAAYAHSPTAFGLSALDDQQIGGVVMWVPAGLVYLACGLLLAGQALAPRAACRPQRRRLATDDTGSPADRLSCRS